MSELTEHPPVDKSEWPAGPWHDEPDRIEWEHAGRPCLMVRHPRSGHWCGYAAVDPGHPLHGQDYNDVPYEDADGNSIHPHGGLTYASECSGHICHVPKPGQPDAVFWFGFDCAHSGDVSPGHLKWEHENGFDHRAYETYKEVPYVKAETERLAEQLVALA